MPQGLKAWLDLLQSRPLPMLSSTKAELQELMSNTQLSVMQYAGPILFDPGLAVQLLKKANRSRASAGRQALSTLSNVMSHLGQALLKQQLDQARYFIDLKLSDTHQAGYLRYVAQACHAALQARDWAQSRGTHEPEEMQLAALLQNIAELALWCHGDDAMPQIEQRVYVDKQSYDKATREVLGCSARELSAALAETWHLPELSQQALYSDYSGFTLATGVALSAQLARLSATSWYDSQCKQCIDNIAAYKGKFVGDVESRIHQNALALTERFMHLGYVPPAKLFPMLVDETYVDPSYRVRLDKPEASLATPASRPQATPAPVVAAKKISAPAIEKSAASTRSQAAAPAPARSVTDSPQKTAKPLPAKSTTATPDKTPATTGSTDEKPPATTANELAAAISKIQKMIKQRVVVQQLLQQVVDTIHLLGFDRVMFALKVPKHKILVGQFFAQHADVKALQNIKIPLDKPHLFSLLMEKTQVVWLQDKNRAKYLKMIPPATMLQLDNDRFVAMSVFTSTRPLGLMYADKAKNPVTQDDYKKFQALCRMLSKGVDEILSSKQAAAKK